MLVEGHLDVDWSWTPLIRAEQVRVANAPWSKALYARHPPPDLPH